MTKLNCPYCGSSALEPIYKVDKDEEPTSIVEFYECWSCMSEIPPEEVGLTEFERIFGEKYNHNE